MKDSEIKDVKEKITIFYKNKIFVFVKRISGGGYPEYINGYILDQRDDFFMITDDEEPNNLPRLIMFTEVMGEGFVEQSKKIPKQTFQEAFEKSISNVEEVKDDWL